MAYTVSLADAREMVKRCLFVGLMPMVTGSPGCGKSEMIKSIANEYNLKLIDERLSTDEPPDMKGYPNINYETGKASYYPMDIFPLETDPIPEGYDGWMLFLDELNSADEDMQKSAYKTVYDLEVGNHKLHPRCVLVGAGNLETDNAIVNELSTAMQSRMVHIEISMDKDPKRLGWLQWAAENNLDHRILSYIRFEPDNLFRFNPDHDDKTFACPRTWEFVSRLIKDKENLDQVDKALIAGAVSEGVARQFTAFCDIYENLPTIESIKANPDTTPVPAEASVQFAVSGSVGAHMDSSNVGSLIQFVNRMPKEFQVIIIRDAIYRDPSLRESTEINQWISKNATELFS